jgi:serine protease AprX
MKRILLLCACACALAAAGCRDDAPTGTPVIPDAPRGALIAPAGVKVDPDLAGLLAAAAPTDRIVVLVNFDPARTSASRLGGAVRGLGAGVMQFKHLSVIAALATPAQVSSMLGMPGVQGVYDNGRDQVLLRESVATLRADRVWATGVTGKGVGIAIMDSGIDGTNPDVAFPSKTVANLKFTASFDDVLEDDGTPRPGGELFLANLSNTDLSSGHGTHVAGTAAGSGGSTFGGYRGVAHGASLVGLSVGEGLAIVNIVVLQAADWLLEHGHEYNVQVVNCSWGGTGEFDPLDPVNEAMSALHGAGITVVFAAGNDGPAENTMNYRSVNPDVISVAAGCKLWVLDPTNSAGSCQDAAGRAAVLASFSSRGVAGDPMQHPDVTAPGVNIVSTRSSTGTALNVLDAPGDALSCNLGVQNLRYYTCSSGTSMASPHVAGVVALMEEASGGRLTPDQALSILQATARPLPGFAGWEVGSGYVDAYAAVQQARLLRR